VISPALRQSRINGVLTSCVVHGVVIATAFFLTTSRESTRFSSSPAAYEPPSHIVWLSAAGPGGGGGGGGKKDQAPARAAEVKGNDKVTMPSAPARAAPDVTEKPEPPALLPEVPVQMLGVSDLTTMGLIEAGAESLSNGSGDGGGVGDRRGTGAGPGDGPGIGPGRYGNIGGDIYQPGSGVTMPVPVHQEKPQYTIEAMRARIQGAVVVECVVQPTGECAQLRVLRSLDSRLGLDQQALRAAAAWRFSPGTRLGQPVAVVVTIQVGFSIH
jgi:periplasmic protein TonB